MTERKLEQLSSKLKKTEIFSVSDPITPLICCLSMIGFMSPQENVKQMKQMPSLLLIMVFGKVAAAHVRCPEVPASSHTKSHFFLSSVSPPSSKRVPIIIIIIIKYGGSVSSRRGPLHQPSQSSRFWAIRAISTIDKPRKSFRPSRSTHPAVNRQDFPR